MLRLACAVALILSLALAASCSPFPSYRYKITVEVETPEGLKTGSSVIEVRSYRQWKILPDVPSTHSDIVGEAVAVELSNGETLFALLQGEQVSAESLARNLLVGPKERASSTPEQIAGRLATERRTAIVPRYAYPILVKFGNKRQPSSAKWVDPDNQAASLGPENRISRIAIETTDDPITTVLEQHLPWVSSYRGRILVKMPNGFLHDLRIGHFKRPIGA